MRQAILAQDFGAVADGRRGGRPPTHLPSIDLAVAAFPRNGAPVAANVLFSRDHPQGLVAEFEGPLGSAPGPVSGAAFGSVRNVRYLADQRDAALNSIAWFPGADWDAMSWQPLAGSGPHRFVAPYPASLLKVMVAVGVGLAVDRGLTSWPEQAMAKMITLSDNDATTQMVALIHGYGLMDALHERFAACGLITLRLKNTRHDGAWGNGAGSGVGQIQMTGWDSMRLMWLLDADAPPPPWLAPGTRLLSEAAAAKIRGWLDAQELHQILNSQRVVGMPGWVRGIPSEVHFAHKTGTTENYASDAGIARGKPPLKRHYIVALLSNLGTRYAPHADLATTWRLPALGAAIDALLAPWLEA